jgi:hypothetical protein
MLKKITKKRLASAAPVMVEAIRNAAWAASVGRDDEGDYARIPRKLYDALENALNAATGEFDGLSV